MSHRDLVAVEFSDVEVVMGGGTMAGVDIDTLTMEQYLALSLENQAPGVVKPKIDGNTQSCSEFFPSLLPEPQKDGWTDSLQELSIHGLSLKKHLSKGPIPGMTPAQDLTAIQTMADHSQKWHDGMTSRKIGSSSSNDGLAALVNKLDNLGQDMKKLKESEVKQAEEVRYGEFGRTTPFNGNNGGKFHVGQPGYYTKTDNRPPYGERRKSLEELLAKHQEESARRSTEMEVLIKKLQENAEINTRNQNASLKNLETQIEQLTKEIHSDKTPSLSSRKNKITTTNQETSVLNKLYGVSFILETETPEALQHQLPPKELNPGSFTLP
ncbi:hypothetical protein Tco_0091918 [Tanacetum coccineum]